MPAIRIAAFYKFVPLSGLKAFREELWALCNKEGIKGTILLSAEGINSTVAGPKGSIDALLDFLRKHKGLAGLEAKFAEYDTLPFHRMKVRLKKEIVTLGVPGIDPAKLTGPHISSDQWNEIISDPETLVLDTRNDYETKIGTFKGAVVPPLETFRDFPKYVEDNLDPKKHKNIAMFCTGGIRCEKASAYMLQKGFKNVVQLEGGILKYIEETPEDESLWQGDCFVFDGRVGVDQELGAGELEMCPSCRWPLTPEDIDHPDYEEGVSCPQCRSSLSEQKIASSRERHKQIKLAEKRGTKHLG